MERTFGWRWQGLGRRVLSGYLDRCTRSPSAEKSPISSGSRLDGADPAEFRRAKTSPRAGRAPGGIIVRSCKGSA
jgi:hypothetical protein